MEPSNICGVDFWNLWETTWSFMIDCFSLELERKHLQRTIILWEHNLLHVHSSICSP